jgi:hypothetical protein
LAEPSRLTTESCSLQNKTRFTEDGKQKIYQNW